MADGRYTGTVASVAISGYGPNSEEVVAVLSDGEGDHALAIYSDYEPGAVAAYVQLLMAALTLKIPVDIDWVEHANTPAISQVIFPAGSQP